MIYNFNEIVGILKSTDRGSTWNTIVPALPTSHQNWQPCGAFPASCYPEVRFEVSTGDAETFVFGNQQLWKFDGAWNEIASDNYEPPYYIDDYYYDIEWHPTQSNIFLVATRGGIYRSEDGGVSFSHQTYGLNTSMALDCEVNDNGDLFVGTNDLGSIVVLHDSIGIPGEHRYLKGDRSSKNSGTDIEISHMADWKFVAEGMGRVERSRINSSAGFEFDGLDQGGANSYVTKLVLWESDNAVWSKDSILFKNDPKGAFIGIGNGTTNSFSGFLPVPHASAEIMLDSLRISDGSQTIWYSSASSDFIGDGDAIFNTDSNKIEASFTQVPRNGARIRVTYSVSYPLGSTIVVSSLSDGRPFEYILPIDLDPGDHIKIQDPFQSILLTNVPAKGAAFGSELSITRDALRSDIEPRWLSLPYFFNFNDAMFSPDGSSLLIAEGSQLYRVGGIDKLKYPMTDQEIEDALTIQPILSRANKILVLYRSELIKDRIFIGTDGFPGEVSVLDSVFSSTSHVIATRLYTDGRVDDILIPNDNQNAMFLASYNGLVYTDDWTIPFPDWKIEPGFPQIPISSIRQLGSGGSKSSLFLGTWGAGIWKSDGLVGYDKHGHLDHTCLSCLNFYPNPTSGRISWDIPSARYLTEISIYDLQGRLVGASSLKKDQRSIELEQYRLNEGYYLVQIRSEDTAYSGKIFFSGNED